MTLTHECKEDKVRFGTRKRHVAIHDGYCDVQKEKRI